MTENSETKVQPVFLTYNTSPLSITDWLITFILLTIPVVNLIMFIYWIVSTTGNINRKNYLLANLIWFAIIFVIITIVLFVFGGMAAIMSYQGTQM